MASILIVDEDKAVAQIVRPPLERDGHLITHATDGSTALRIFRDEKFELLIVDIFMEGMDGLDTMKLVHRYRPGVPIIVVSGRAFASRGTAAPDFLGMSTKLGAVCSLHKPCKSAILLSHVTQFLPQDSSQAAVAQPAATSAGC